MTAKLLLGAALLGGGYLGWILAWIALAHLRWRRFHRHEGRAIPRLGRFGWTRLYLRTIVALLRLTAWWALAPAGRPLPRLWPDEIPRIEAIVLCVHGFQMDGTCFWALRRRLARRGRVSFAVDLGLPYRRPEVYAAALRRDLGTLEAAFPGARFDIVAHSMGGLVVRHALSDAPALARRVRRVVTLGTPHRGTVLLGWFRHGPVWRMMGPGSEYLRRLPGIAAVAPAAEVTTIASAHDLIVYPSECAHLEGASRIDLERVGHFGLLTDGAVLELVARRLDGESASGAGEPEDRGAEQQRAEESERE